MQGWAACPLLLHTGCVFQGIIYWSCSHGFFKGLAPQEGPSQWQPLWKKKGGKTELPETQWPFEWTGVHQWFLWMGD